MGGIAIMPITVSTAPIMPVAAANTPHMEMVAMASPPGMRPVHSCIASNKRRAIDVRSSIDPMKINSGIAAKTELPATPIVRP